MLYITCNTFTCFLYRHGNGPITIQPLDDVHPGFPGGMPPGMVPQSNTAQMPRVPPMLPGGITIKPEPQDNFSVSNVSIQDDQAHAAPTAAPAR